MKKLFFLFIIQHLSLNIYAQSGTMLPDGFIIPNLATSPGCTVDDNGKMYYNSTTKLLMLCNGTEWQATSSQWNDNQLLPNTINFGGLVGINTTTPQFQLDVNGTARISNNLLAAQFVGIGTTTPSAALEVVDGDIAITSSVDAKTWKFDYSDANNSLSLQENGTARMVFANGGNIGIGSIAPTAKLSVDGTGSFSSDLTVNSGKGIVRSATATQLKCYIAQVNLGATFTVNAGTCATSAAVSYTSAAFSSAPTAQVGNLVSGTGDFGKFVINVQSTTATQAVVRFCNVTASNITLSSAIFNLMCFGQ